MHTQTDTKTARLRHRLYVVLPLFLALAVAGVGGGATGSVLSDALHTHSGTLVAGKSFMTTEIDGLQMKGWNGVFEIDRTNPTQVTLAALTTPVIASRGADTWLVPVGMQLTIPDDAAHPSIASRRPLPLPAHYLRERLPDAERLWEQMPMPAMAEPAVAGPPLLHVSLQLSRAHDEAERSDAARRLWTLSDALERGDFLTFDTVVREPRTTAALQQADLGTLLTQAFHGKRDMHILPFVLRDAKTATLLRFHPLTRDRVWLVTDGEMDIDILLLAQTLQPYADRATDAASDIAIQAWKDGWQVLSASGAVAPDTLAEVIPTIVADIIALDTAGYPARARAYAAALVHGLELSDVSTTARSALDDLRVVYDVPSAVAAALTDVMAAPVAEMQETASSASSVHPIVPEAAVRAMLAEAGCMFTVQSALHLRDDGLYDVSGAVIGTGSGDQFIDFTFDPSAGLVSNIEHEGKILPYSLPLGKYLEWVKAGN